MNELDFINRLKEIATHPAARGLADDAAVIPFGRQKLVLTHDMMIEGVHFLPEANPADVAWKLVAVNLSDLAAKGAKPLGILLGYSRSGNEWDEVFMLGLKQAIDHFCVPLLGGDTVSPKQEGSRTLGLTAFGEVKGHIVPSRGGAMAGHSVYVTGAIGDGWAGLQLAKGGTNATDATAKLVKAYNRPQPRMDEGRALSTLVSAMMDISDGLLLDVSRIADASNVAIEIDLAKIPLSPEFTSIFGDDQNSRMKAATGGDDYQLLLTASPETVLPVPAIQIGLCKSGTGLITLYDGQMIEQPVQLGFVHA